MANVVEINLSGDKELVRALEQLPAAVENRVLKFALREAAKPILKAARANAPKDTGLLKKSIKIKNLRNRKGSVAVIVGAGAGAVNLPTGKAFYGYFQERGWVTGKRTAAERQAQKKGSQREPRQGQRKIPGKFFIRRAFDANQQAAKEQIRDLTIKGIEREAARLAVKAARARAAAGSK